MCWHENDFFDEDDDDHDGGWDFASLSRIFLSFFHISKGFMCNRIDRLSFLIKVLQTAQCGKKCTVLCCAKIFRVIDLANELISRKFCLIVRRTALVMSAQRAL